MNKQELIDAVASEVGIAKSAAAETIDAFLATVTNAVVKGDPVQLIGFGSFSTGARAARAGRNPKTGEALRSPRQRPSSLRPAKRSRTQ